MKTEWNDIRAGDPPDNAVLLVTRDGKVDIAETAFDLYFDVRTGLQMHGVTHWAALPEPA